MPVHFHVIWFLGGRYKIVVVATQTIYIYIYIYAACSSCEVRQKCAELAPSLAEWQVVKLRLEAVTEGHVAPCAPKSMQVGTIFKKLMRGLGVEEPEATRAC